MTGRLQNGFLKTGENRPRLDISYTKTYEFALNEHDFTLFQGAFHCLSGNVDEHAEPLDHHSERLVDELRRLHVDESTLLAAAYGSSECFAPAIELAKKQLSPEAYSLLEHMTRVRQLASINLSAGATAPTRSQEALRKLFLALASDMRVVLIVLVSRLQTLRWYASQGKLASVIFAQETLDVLAPLANRLGVWQIKWELEDLGLRFANPQRYQWIARQIEERRTEREIAIAHAKQRLDAGLLAANINAHISGRPKHIFSIHQKMLTKGLQFSDIHDLRALRVVVSTVDDCYGALSVIQSLWPEGTGDGFANEFDDYIAKPKSNGYRSLHTVVWAPDGKAFEIQIRTQEMHEHAEFGVAAHWRYKEQGSAQLLDQRKRQTKAPSEDAAARQLAWMRQLLSWQIELGASLSADTAQSLLNEYIYALTPEARVIELPAGSTPIDFAYHVHSSLGHKCRGARVDGHMVPLNTVLLSGQTIEIIIGKAGAAKLGPSRDWLNLELGFVKSTRARNKVRQWFHALELENQIASGRSIVEKQLQREGKTAVPLDALAQRLGFDNAADLFVAVARDEIGPRAVEEAIRFDPAMPLGKSHAAKSNDVLGEDHLDNESAALLGKERATGAGARSDVLVVGVDLLLTQLARCCRPVPPDSICGYVTRGKGVSIHRQNCPSFLALQKRSPERCLDTNWGQAAAATPKQTAKKRISVYPVDCVIEAVDRQGLLRDITELLARERINVTAVQSQTKAGRATIKLTMEVQALNLLEKALAALRNVVGILGAQRR